MRSLLSSALCVAAVVGLAGSSADAACVPAGTAATVKVTVGAENTIGMAFHGATTGYILNANSLSSFDYTNTATTITHTVIAGTGASTAWGGDQTTGTAATFIAVGTPLMKGDGTRLWFTDDKYALEVELTSTFAIRNRAGAAVNACAEGTAGGASFTAPYMGTWANGAESSILMPVQGCHVIATFDPATYAVKHVVGDASQNVAAGFGTAAKVAGMGAIARWGNRYYSMLTTATAYQIGYVVPQDRYRLTLVTGAAAGGPNANLAAFDSTWAMGTADARAISTFDTCWLSIYSSGADKGYMVDVDAGLSYVIASIAGLTTPKYPFLDPAGNLWMAAGPNAHKYTLALATCKAATRSCHSWNTATMTARLPVTRTRTAPVPRTRTMTYVAPPTTVAVTSAVTSAAAATTAAAVATTTAAAATTTAAAATTTAAAATTTVAASTTTAAAASTSAATTTSAAGSGAAISTVMVAMFSCAIAIFA